MLVWWMLTGSGQDLIPRNSLREFWQLWELHVAPHDSPRNTAWFSLGIHATTRERSFFWYVLSPDSAQFKRGTGMLQMFSRFVTVGLGMFARFACYFQTCMKQLYFICVFGVCFISTKFKQTAVDVKHGSLVEHCSWCQTQTRQTAVDVEHSLLGVHVVCKFFLMFTWCETNETDGSWCKTQQSCEAQNSWCWFWFLRSSTEREFTAKMSQHMFWRATSKMSERKTSGDTTVETSQVQCLAELFSFSGVCEGWNSFGN